MMTMFSQEYVKMASERTERIKEGVEIPAASLTATGINR